MQTWDDFFDKIREESETLILISGHGEIDTIGEAPYAAMVIGNEPVRARIPWIVKAPELVKPGGWVMLGNANRREYAKERAEIKAKAAKVKTFDCNEGGSKFRVVEFYQMPGKPKRRSKDGENDLSR